MNRSQSLSPPKISDFEFSIRTIAVTFQNQNDIGRLRLYIEKGMQIIGIVEEEIIAPKGNQERSVAVSPISEQRFRALNEHQLSYQWSAYQILDDGQQNFLESTNFTLSKVWKDYIKRYTGMADQMSADLIRQGDSERIAERWKELSQAAETISHSNTALLKNSKILIEYEVHIQNDFDVILQQHEKEKARKFKERQERIQLRSTLAPKSFIDLVESNKPRSELLKTQAFSKKSSQEPLDVQRDLQQKGKVGSNLNRQIQGRITSATVRSGEPITKKDSLSDTNQREISASLKHITLVEEESSEHQDASNLLIRLDSNPGGSRAKCSSQKPKNQSSEQQTVKQVNRSSMDVKESIKLLILLMALGFVVFQLMNPTRKV